MRVVWYLGLAGGLVAGGLVLADIPLIMKLLVGLAVIVVGVAGPFGSVLLAGLLLGAGLVTFLGVAPHVPAGRRGAISRRDDPGRSPAGSQPAPLRALP